LEDIVKRALSKLQVAGSSPNIRDMQNAIGVISKTNAKPYKRCILSVL